MRNTTHHLTTLPNGLRIVSAEIPSARSVAISFFIGTGSRCESDDIQGVSHFVEHVLFKGTRKRPTAKLISEAIEGLGGILNAETGKEFTVYWDKVAEEHWRSAFEVLTDLLRYSLFDPTEIEKERRVIIEELSTLVDSPGDWVHVLADEAMWGDQPLGRDVGGTKESVSALTRDAMLDYLHQRYVASNVVVSVVGAVPHLEVVEYAATLLQDWPTATPEPWPAANDLGPESRICLRSKRTEQAHFCLVAPGISYLDSQRFVLDVLNVVLGEGMSSRLFLDLREDRGLAYDVHSYINHYRDAGSVVIYAGVDPRRIAEAIQAALDVARTIADDFGEDELARAKEFLRGRTLLRLEDTRSISSWLGSQILLLGEVMSVEQLLAAVSAVTVEDVKRLARRLFVDQPWHLSVIGPYTSEDRFLRLLDRPRSHEAVGALPRVASRSRRARPST